METGQKLHWRNRLGKAKKKLFHNLTESRRFDHDLLRNFQEILNKYGIVFPSLIFFASVFMYVVQKCILIHKKTLPCYLLNDDHHECHENMAWGPK